MRIHLKKIFKVLDYEPCKNKKLMGIFQTNYKAGVNNMGVESILTTNLKTYRTEKCKINMHTVQGRVKR